MSARFSLFHHRLPTLSMPPSRPQELFIRTLRVGVPSTWDITGVDTSLLTRGVSLSSPGCYGNRLRSLGGQVAWDPGDLKVV